MKKYKLTPEHEALLPVYRDKWIANAMLTKPMDDHDRSEMRKAIKGLYHSAGLEPPPDNRIIFVASPFIMRFSAGFAAAIWYLRKNPQKATEAATRATTWDATRDATWDATRAATEAATWDATRDATEAATWDATWAATEDATWAATEAATEAATRATTRDATEAATWVATRDATWAATEAATWAATEDATWAATEDATWAATEDAAEAATEAATRATTWDATRDATRAATRAATEDATWDATRAATEDATWDATWAATEDATWAATEAATRATTRDATEAATWVATRDATWAATEAATWDATRAATEAAWYSFPISKMKSLSTSLGLFNFGLMCAREVWKMWQGGNQWSASSSYLNFFKEVAKLPIDWEKWNNWEKASIHGGTRILHSEFCIISDRPHTLTVDSQNRPHADGTPFCQWRDGSALFAFEGVRMPAKYGAIHSSKWEPEWIDQEKNADIRTALLKGIGYDRWIQATGGDVVNEQTIHGLPYQLIVRQDPQIGTMKFLKMKNPSVPNVFHVEPVAPHDWIKTCDDALRWRQIGDEAKNPDIVISYQSIK